MNLVQGKRYAVFSIRKPDDKKNGTGSGGTDRGSIWVRAGSAWVNKDGSINVYLDVLPIDGHLHVREVIEKPRESREPATGTTTTRITLEPQPQAGLS